MKLAKKLGVSHLIMGIFPLLIFGWIFYSIITSTLTKNTYQDLTARNSIKVDQIDGYFIEKENNLKNLSDMVGVLKDEGFSKLSAVAKIKKKSVDRYFQVIKDQVVTLSEDIMIIDAMKEFSEGFSTYLSETKFDVSNDVNKNKIAQFYKEEFNKKFKDVNGIDNSVTSLYSNLSDQGYALQSTYIVNNSELLGEKHKLDYANDGSNYSKSHEKYHPTIRSYLEKFGYYDIFLLDTDSGDIVYSVFKELDYATSLVTGPYSKTNFANAFKKANRLNKGEYVLVDYKKYLPSYNSPASFIASPIFDRGQRIGVLIFQMPIDRLNNIMGEREGLGKSGETYLVGGDYLMRSDSYLDQTNRTVFKSFQNPVKGKVETDAVKKALQGKSGESIIRDYNNNLVLSVYTPLTIGDFTWALVSEIDLSEAFVPILSGKRVVNNKSWQNDMFSKYIQDTGYYDLFLIDAGGYCFYSVTHESDYQTNLLTGEFKDSGLGQLVKDIIISKKSFSFVDFAPYAPSAGAPASFIGVPIKSGKEVNMILALQLSSGGLTDLLQKGGSKSQKLESYLVGSDGLLRTNSVINEEYTLEKSFELNKIISTQAVLSSQKQANGKYKLVDTQIITGYQGNKVLSSWEPISVFGVTWSLITEKDKDKALSVLDSIQEELLSIALIVLLLIGSILYIINNRVQSEIISPILNSVEFAKDISKGDLSKVMKLDGNDELSDLVQSLNEMSKFLAIRLAIIEDNPANIVCTNPEGEIWYVNPSSNDSFEQIGLKTANENLVGSNLVNLDLGLSSLSHILQNSQSLPHAEIIDIGEEKIEVLITAILGTDGAFVGPMIIWSIISDQLKEEAEKKQIATRMAKIFSMTENLPVNIITADLDGIITYMNPASFANLKQLQNYLPISVESVVGSSYDVFHKRPDHQRKILADVNNLPYTSEIGIGNEILILKASATLDNNGIYIGPMITWEVITEEIEQKKREEGMNSHIRNLLDQVAITSTRLSENSNNLSGISGRMTDSAEHTYIQASSVASDSRELNANVQSVAVSSGQMSASVSEIAIATHKAAEVAIKAVKLADEAGSDVANLGESSTQIGNVVKSISAIAEQTNLLALNATIEAARAGDAGKGFGVVANEVKELANETAKATEEISDKINSVQTEVSQVVQIITSFKDIIEEINDSQASIASAVEEQSVTMGEITQNANQAAVKSDNISGSIDTVAQSVEETKEVAISTLEAAKTLSQHAQELNDLVDKN